VAATRRRAPELAAMTVAADLVRESLSRFQALQIRPQLRHRLVAEIAVFLEALGDDVVHLGGHAGVQRARRIRAVVKNCVEQTHSGLAGERLPAGGHLVQDHTG
jgi:hypothetical protein